MLRIGMAKVDITPPLGTPCSLGLDDGCELIFDPPFVRALVLSDGEKTVCVLSADLIGLQHETHRDLQQAIYEKTGIPPEHVVAHATHTHEAPNVQIGNNRELAPYGLVFADPDYYQTFLGAAARAAASALADLFPASVETGRGLVQGVASNRRLIDENGQVLMRYSRPGPELRAYPEGDIDPWVRVIRLREQSGEREALILNYCCHPTAAGGDEERYATADFPGHAMRLLEAERPGRFCTYFTGPCGDINPGKYVGDGNSPEDRMRDVRLLGSRLAEGIRAALRDMAPLRRSGLNLMRQPLALPLRSDLPSREELRASLAEAVQQYREAKRRGERVPGGGDIRRLAYKLQILRLSENGSLPTEVVALRIGEAALCFLPGECFLALARSLWRAFPDTPLLPVAPTHYMSYIPTPESYQAGGYEPGVAHVGPEAFQTLVEAATRTISQV